MLQRTHSANVKVLAAHAQKFWKLPFYCLASCKEYYFLCLDLRSVFSPLPGTPNSNRVIEIELSRRFTQDSFFDHSCLPSVDDALVPHALRKFHDNDGAIHCQDVNYTKSASILFILQHSFADKFELQKVIDRGDVTD